MANSPHCRNTAISDDEKSDVESPSPPPALADKRGARGGSKAITDRDDDVEMSDTTAAKQRRSAATKKVETNGYSKDQEDEEDEDEDELDEEE